MKSLKNLGSPENPVKVVVDSDHSADRVERLCRKFNISTVLEIDGSQPIDTKELDYVLFRDHSDLIKSLEPTPSPNNFCPCQSGKKYKKCCQLTRPTQQN